MTNSTSLYCLPEDIRVLAFFIRKLEFGDIEGHVLLAHLVKGANHAPLEDAPLAPGA